MSCDNKLSDLLKNRPGCGGLGSGATGYWGRSVYLQLAAEQQYGKQRALLFDKLLSNGLRTELWIGVETGNRCACYNEAHKAADRKCGSCHGIGLVPGYTKFGHDTVWMSATDADVTLTGLEITTTFKSAKVQLTAGTLAGTIESGDKAVDRTATGSAWEYDVSSFIRIDGSSNIAVEYSIDSGSNWLAISGLATANPSSGVIRFKATLTRTTSSVLSPLFEIMRARYGTIDLEGSRISSGDEPDTCISQYGPWIYVMNEKPRQNYLKSEHGDLPTYTMKFWTMGLASFDSSLTVNSSEELLEGPSVAFRFLDGVLANERKYVMTDWQMSDPGAYMVTIQTFTMRVADEVGPYAAIF